MQGFSSFPRCWLRLKIYVPFRPVWPLCCFLAWLCLTSASVATTMLQPSFQVPTILHTLELLLHLQGCNSLWGFSHWHQRHSIVHISWKQLASMCSCHLQSQFHGRECVGDKNRGLPFCKRSQKIRPTALHAARQCPVPTNLQVECAAWDRKHNNKLRCKRNHSAKLLSFVFPLLLFCCSNC